MVHICNYNYCKCAVYVHQFLARGISYHGCLKHEIMLTFSAGDYINAGIYGHNKASCASVTDPSNFEDSTARGLELELLLFREDMSDIDS